MRGSSVSCIRIVSFPWNLCNQHSHFLHWKCTFLPQSHISWLRLVRLSISTSVRRCLVSNAHALIWGFDSKITLLYSTAVVWISCMTWTILLQTFAKEHTCMSLFMVGNYFREPMERNKCHTWRNFHSCIQYL